MEERGPSKTDVGGPNPPRRMKGTAMTIKKCKHGWKLRHGDGMAHGCTPDEALYVVAMWLVSGKQHPYLWTAAQHKAARARRRSIAQESTTNG
jgi:hypothetical protein